MSNSEARSRRFRGKPALTLCRPLGCGLTGENTTKKRPRQAGQNIALPPKAILGEAS
jgi:hypothetical protein